jgi:HEAT repeat protein
MMYIRVSWLHGLVDEPVLLYSEISDEREEVRKVEIYADGRRGYASKSCAVGDTRLSETPLPTVVEIGADPQFEATEIGEEEFDRVWSETVVGDPA